MFDMTHFLKLCYNVFILENKIDTPVFRKILCKNVLYHVGNCISLCQYGEGFLLVGGGGHNLDPSSGRQKNLWQHKAEAGPPTK
jgi:hypothetical protein